MAQSLEDRIDEIEENFNKEVADVRALIQKGDARIERFINGEKDLGAKGMLERLIRMEDAYKQYETLMKLIEWIDKIIGWAKYALPLIGAAMAYSHWNLHVTNEVLPK